MFLIDLISTLMRKTTLFGFLLLLFNSAIVHAQGSAAGVMIGSAAIGAEWMSEFNTGAIKIDRIELLEPNLIPKDYFDAVVEPYLGKELKVKDLQNVQRQLSRYYVSLGYVSSGVVIPKQRILNGVIRLQAIHGRVTKIQVTGNRRINDEFFYAQAAKGLSVPLDFYEVQRAMVLMKQNQFVRDVKAQIVPADELGENILKLSVEETEPFQVSIHASNTQSPYIGGERVGLSIRQRNWPGGRQVIALDIGKTRGLNDVSGSYGIPLGYSGAYFNAFGAYADFAVVDERSSSLNIESKSISGGTNLTLPLIAKSTWDTQAQVGFDVKSIESNGFTGNIAQRVSVGSAGLHLNKHGSKLVAAAAFGVRFGFDALNATVATDGSPDGLFTSFNAQAFISGRMFGSSQIVLRGIGQYTKDQLLPMEEFAVGGMYSVRGYRENFFVRDNGLVGSLEIRLPLFTPKLLLAPFVDAGRSWDVHEIGAENHTLASVGVGVVTTPFKRLNAEIYWGKALIPITLPGNDLQDKGIHARVSFDLF